MKATRPAKRGRLFLVALLAGVAPLALGAAPPAHAGNTGLSTLCVAAGTSYPPYVDGNALVEACTIILCHVTCGVTDLYR